MCQAKKDAVQETNFGCPLRDSRLAQGHIKGLVEIKEANKFTVGQEFRVESTVLRRFVSETCLAIILL